MNILKSYAPCISSKTSFESYETLSNMYSEQAMVLACRFSLLEESFEREYKPHMFFQLLKNFFETIKSQDPDQVHYDIARSTLYKIDNEALKNDIAVDMLAREILNACHAFDKHLKMPIAFEKLIKRNLLSAKNNCYPYLLVIELPKALDVLDEEFFTSERLSIWDGGYLKLLETTGKLGKKQSKELSKKFASHTRKWDARFWFKEHALEHGVHFFHSPAFLGLAEILWHDIVSPRISKIRHA